MKPTTAIVTLIVIVILGGGLYWWYTSAYPAGPAGTAGINGSPDQGNLGGAGTGTPEQPGGDGTSVNQNLILGVSSNATLGQYLTAYNGMTLYLYTPDTPNKSNCTGQCAVNWPPYTVASAAGINVPANITGAVGTTVRADGSLQVTYKGVPLYFYIKDKAVGDTTGQGVGGVWYVVKP